MNKLTIFRAILPVLAFSSAAAFAQDIDFDDITMTVVGDGMFEARQLPRPSSDAIREFMEAELGEPPNLAGPGLASPGLASPGLASPGLVRPGLEEPSLEEPSLEQPGLEEPGQARPDQASPIQDLSPPFDAGPAPVVFQQPPDLRSAGERPDTRSVREVIEPDNRDTVSDLRSQRPSPRDQRNERPTRPQRPGNRG